MPWHIKSLLEDRVMNHTGTQIDGSCPICAIPNNGLNNTSPCYLIPELLYQVRVLTHTANNGGIQLL